jgi:hypothetical protein
MTQGFLLQRFSFPTLPTLRRVAQAIALASCLMPVLATAADLRVLPDGNHPEDSRLEPLKDLDGYFPFEVSTSVEAWEARSARRRLALQVALGLWPQPTRTPVEAVVHGRLDLEGYSVEKVYFQSMPGFYVTGNLYRPAQASADGKYPLMLCPHGHFADGRFGESSREAVRRDLVIGAERFEDGGRNQIQSRCAHLARMGCLVFQYDMIGYCDSTQLSFELIHSFAQQRSEMISPNAWGLFSPQAESNLQSIAGLQTWNSIRALDWLLTLPEVDAKRVGVTGASGGGTQTFLFCALDPRPTIAIPAVMVSTAMQGGCTCENASLLRVGTGNVEFAALMAPRPLCLISADDWTREMSTKGFPELKAHYELLGAGDRVEHHPLLHFKHNYNYVSRGVMYQFVNREFQLGLETPVVEESYRRLVRDELTVWNEQHPRPESGPEFERKLLRWWADDARQQLDALVPRDPASLEAYRATVAPAWDTLLGRRLPSSDRIELQENSKQDRAGHWEIRGLLEYQVPREDPGVPAQTEVLPTVFLVPKNWNSGPVAIWLSRDGKASLQPGEAPRAEVQQLLDANVSVVGVDLSEQGELRSSEGPLVETRRVKNPRESAAYTLGYNRALFAQRVHDVLTVIGFATAHERKPSEIWLVALDGAGPWAAAACAQADGMVKRAVVDTQGFRFQNLMNVRHGDLLPGGAKYHDLPGLLALSAPTSIRVTGESPESLTVPRAAYQAGGVENQLQVAGPDDSSNERSIQWLLGR